MLYVGYDSNVWAGLVFAAIPAAARLSISSVDNRHACELRL